MNVLFDLDGTLTDPKPGITQSIAYALERMGVGGVDPHGLGWCIGPPLRGSFGQLLGTDSPEAIAEAIGFYRERFGDVGLFENEVYAGIPELLAELNGQGARLFVATSKPEYYASKIIDRFLPNVFECVVGSELDGRREPKAEVIGHVLSTTGIEAGESLMVGDRMHDVHGAKEHGIRCIGALYGYGHPGELEEAGAHPLCQSPHELSAAIRLLQNQTANLAG